MEQNHCAATKAWPVGFRLDPQEEGGRASSKEQATGSESAKEKQFQYRPLSGAELGSKRGSEPTRLSRAVWRTDQCVSTECYLMNVLLLVRMLFGLDFHFSGDWKDAFWESIPQPR